MTTLVTQELFAWAALAGFVLTGWNLWLADIKSEAAAKFVADQIEENARLLNTCNEALCLAKLGALDEANDLLLEWNAGQKEKVKP